MADEITVVSAERIADELRKMLVDPRRSRCITLMYDLDLVRPILPELLPMKGLPQGLPAAPTGDLWDHVLARAGSTGRSRRRFRWRSRPCCTTSASRAPSARTADRYTFYHHEHVGRRIASEICLRLKLSNEERERIEWLVEKHQYLADAPANATCQIETGPEPSRY